MDSLVKKLLERQRFEKEIDQKRREEVEYLAEVGSEVPPVFNKNHYAAKGSITITQPAREIMTRNEKSFGRVSHSYSLTPSELLAMRGVVDVLKLIHKGVEYVKDALCHVVTVEVYGPHVYVREKEHEHAMSCYYIVYGLTEVTYDSTACGACAVQVFEPNIVYTNGSGEYLGLVSADGRQHDMSPPSGIYTKTDCLLIRIDRDGFHRHVTSIRSELERDKWLFLESENGPLSHLSVDEKSKLLPAFVKVYYSPNKILARQDQVSDVLYIMVSGHCRCVRSVHLKDARTSYLMKTGEFIPGDIVGCECLVDGAPYNSTVYTTTYTTCFKFHRADLEALTKENFRLLQDTYLVKYPEDDMLLERGYRTAAWRRYREHLVTLVKQKDRVVAPLRLPIDVKWGTITRDEIHSKLFITFLAGENRPETGLGPSHTINRSKSAYPAVGRHQNHVRKNNHAKSAPCCSQERNEGHSSMTSSTMASQRSLDVESSDGERDDVVHDRGTYSSLGAHHIVREATEVAEVKSRRRASSVKINEQMSEESSLFSAILSANKTSKTYCAFGRYRLEILRKRLERVRQSRRKLESERKRRTQDKQFEKALRRPQMSTETLK